MGTPGRGLQPSEFIAQLISKAVRPHRVIPVPLRDANGQSLANVHIRCIPQVEEDAAFANAALYVAKLIRDGKDLPWKPDDLEHNARASELLALACRQEKDPELPFFPGGVTDVRFFTTDELGQLMNAYAEVKEAFYPALRELSGPEYEAWLDVIARGGEQFPFTHISRAKLEAILLSTVRSLVDARATITTLTSSSGSDS